MPGPNTSAWLCNKPSDGVCGGKVELDMMSDDEHRRRATPRPFLWARSTEVNEEGKDAQKECVL